MNEPAKVMYGFDDCVVTRFSVAKLSLDDRTAQSRHTAALARPASVGSTTFPGGESSSAIPQFRPVAEPDSTTGHALPPPNPGRANAPSGLRSEKHTAEL